MAKKKQNLSLEEKLQNAIISKDNEPYKIPDNWVWTKLIYSYDNLTSSNKKIKQKDYLEEGNYPIIDQGKNMIGGFSNNIELLYEGSLPVIIFGDHTRNIKYIDFSFIQGADGVKVLRTKKFWNEKCFFYALNSINIDDLGYRRHFPLFSTFKIPLPPLAEQERIVNIIEDLFEKLDSAKEKIEQALLSFENRKTALLYQAFSGQLTKKWREDNQKDFDKKAYFSQFLNGEDIITENIPYEIPENWVWTHWGNIGNFISGNGFSKDLQGQDNNEIPFYKVGSLKNTDSKGFLNDFSNTITEDTRKEIKAKLIEVNSIIFAKIGEAIRLNRRAINNLPCCIDNNLMSFKSDSFNNRFIYYWSLGLDLYLYSNATTVPSVRKSDIELIEIPLPSLEEQEEIVRILDNILEKERESKELISMLDNIDLIKKSILAKAFRGELGTNDPNEESAINLLKEVLSKEQM